jgi:hypothetical protein
VRIQILLVPHCLTENEYKLVDKDKDDNRQTIEIRSIDVKSGYRPSCTQLYDAPEDKYGSKKVEVSSRMRTDQS